MSASELYIGVALGGAYRGMTVALSRSVRAVCWVAAAIQLAALA